MTQTDRTETMRPILRLASKRNTKTESKPRSQTTHYRKAMARQALSAKLISCAIVVLTALSLSDLAEGICLVTQIAMWKGWAMAIGIDVGFILMELACITTVSDKVRHVVHRYARPAIAGTLAGSAIMNSFAFGHLSDNVYMQAAGAAFGCALPALIYCLTRIAAAQHIDCHSKAKD